MPAPLALLVGFTLGVAFAWAAREQILHPDPNPAPVSRPLIIVALFVFLVFLPVVGYFLTFETDWAYLYWVSSERATRVLNALVLIFAVANVFGGFAWASRELTNHHPQRVISLGVVPSAFAVAFALAALPRLATYGSYAQFHHDFGLTSVWGSPLGYALIWFLPILIGAATWTYRVLEK